LSVNVVILLEGVGDGDLLALSAFFKKIQDYIVIVSILLRF